MLLRLMVWVMHLLLLLRLMMLLIMALIVVVAILLLMLLLLTPISLLVAILPLRVALVWILRLLTISSLLLCVICLLWSPHISCSSVALATIALNLGRVGVGLRHRLILSLVCSRCLGLSLILLVRPVSSSTRLLAWLLEVRVRRVLLAGASCTIVVPLWTRLLLVWLLIAHIILVFLINY